MTIRGIAGRLFVAVSGLLLVVMGVSAQAPPPNPFPQGQGAGAGRQGGGGAGRGGRGLTSFPAQQRSAGDPAVVERGKLVYGIHCRSCHGVDLRGGDLGGPNLLRSDVMLNDQVGELLAPILKGSRTDAGMSAIDLPAEDVTAVAAYIHSILATSRGQGAPPAGPLPELTILVGDAAQGEAFFAAKCSGCHSATGDLQRIAVKYSNPMQLQNAWVAGGRGGRGGGAGGAGADLDDVLPPTRRDPTVVVTPQTGPKVEGWLERIDDFSVTVLLADGTRRSFRRTGGIPTVEITDPLATHKSLLQTYTDRDIHNVTAYLVTLK